MKVPVSVIMPVLNEEVNIGNALKSVSWADELFVVDSFSTDRTVEIATDCGAHVYRHRWQGYAEQKNWALENLPVSHEWVFFLDADEKVPTTLAAEIATKILRPEVNVVGYYCNRRMIFLGRWMKHCWWYPDRTLRLFRMEHGRFEDRSVHERVIIRGRVGYLENDLIHDNRKSLYEYLDRHNRYSTLEAIEMYRKKVERVTGDFKYSFWGDWGQRRRAIKERIWYRIPARWLVRFLWMYFWRMGFLDGKEGFIFTMLAVTHEFHIEAKYYEAVRRCEDADYLKLLAMEKRTVGCDGGGVETGVDI